MILNNLKLLDEQPISIRLCKNVIIETSDEPIIDINEEIADFNNDYYVSNGWIDLHTHAYDGFELYGDKTDSIGYRTGVTTLLDAGTTGVNDFEHFLEESQNYKTKVKYLLNAGSTGIVRQDELSDLENIDLEKITEHLLKYDDIIGIKLRLSKSVVKDNGIKPFHIIKDFLKSFPEKKIMVHFGNLPPTIDEILPLCDEKTILTHCFHGKVNNLYNFSNNTLKLLKEAKARNLVLDLGHGTDSFNINIAKAMYEHNILCDTISTDIYKRNRKNGPVYDLATTMSKMYTLGYSIEQIIKRVTENPAAVLGIDKYDGVKKCNRSDLTIFKIIDSDREVADSNQNIIKLEKEFSPHYVYLNGELLNCNE